MSIAPNSIVTVYADLMSYVLVIGLLFLVTKNKLGNDKNAAQIFTWLCIYTAINALSNGISYALHGQSIAVAQPIKLIMPTIAEYSCLLVLFSWSLYVDYMLYRSVDRSRLVYRALQAPIAIFGALCLVNIGTGIMFTMSDKMLFEPKPLFYVFFAAQLVYGIFPVMVINHYIATRGPLHFFHLWPVVIPVAISSLFTLFTGYSARSFGFAIALVFIQFSYVNRWRFDDRESGFYNRHYINYISDLAASGEVDYHSAIVFSVGYVRPELFQILRTEVPDDGEIIRIDKKKFLVFCVSSKHSMLSLISEMVTEAADEFDKLHPNEVPLDICSDFLLRRKGMSSQEFIESVDRKVQ